MERTKKMLLVDPETVERFKQSTTPSTNVKTDTGDEMSRILNSADMDDRDKLHKLYQVMQRFFHFASEARKPLAVEISNTPEDSAREVLDNDNQTLKSLTIAALPNMSKEKGALMFDRLVASDAITWDNLGVVSVRGKKIAGSSITDLISDSVRNRRSGSPIGWRDFTTILGDTNMPTELIGNTRRKEFIRDRHMGRTTSLNSSASEPVSIAGPSSSDITWAPFSF